MNENLSLSERSVRTRVVKGIALYAASRSGRSESVESCRKWHTALLLKRGDLLTAQQIAKVVIRDVRVYLDHVERILAGQ